MKHSSKSACPTSKDPAEPVHVAAPILAITPGEPAGIGPEILLRLCREHPEFRVLAVADPELLRETSDRLGADMEIRTWQPGAEVFQGDVCLCDVGW